MTRLPRPILVLLLLLLLVSVGVVATMKGPATVLPVAASFIAGD